MGASSKSIRTAAALIMSNTIPRTNLPAALTSSLDYEALTELQRRGLTMRLNLFDEAAEKAHVISGPPDLIHDLDDIELDVLTLLSVGTPSETVSAYKIHSSWTFECEFGRNHSENELMQILSSSSFTDAAGSESASIAWVKNWGRQLRSAMNAFYIAESFTSAVSQLMIADALAALYVVFMVRFRIVRR